MVPDVNMRVLKLIQDDGHGVKLVSSSAHTEFHFGDLF